MKSDKFGKEGWWAILAVIGCMGLGLITYLILK